MLLSLVAIRRAGKGAKATYALNGQPLDGGFLPWETLTGNDTLDIAVFAK